MPENPLSQAFRICMDGVGAFSLGPSFRWVEAFVLGGWRVIEQHNRKKFDKCYERTRKIHCVGTFQRVPGRYVHQRDRF